MTLKTKIKTPLFLEPEIRVAMFVLVAIHEDESMLEELSRLFPEDGNYVQTNIAQVVRYLMKTLSEEMI